jgi:RimJ/RimL family protein N-acetyltransferase
LFSKHLLVLSQWRYMMGNPETQTHVIFLKGKRVILRPLEKTDAPILQVWFNDPEVMVFMNNSFPIALHEEEAWLSQDRRKERFPQNVVLGIYVEGQGLIGTMGLHAINWIDRTAVTGTCIGNKDCWGKGYGTDAKMTLLNYTFNVLNLRKVNSHILDFNGRSQSFNKKCGYKEVGRLKAERFRGGTYCDEVILSVFREDWEPLWLSYQKD